MTCIIKKLQAVTLNLRFLPATFHRPYSEGCESPQWIGHPTRVVEVVKKVGLFLQ